MARSAARWSSAPRRPLACSRRARNRRCERRSSATGCDCSSSSRRRRPASASCAVPQLTFEFANDHYRALVGGRDLVGKPLLEALPELAGQGLDTLLHGVMPSGQPYVGREVPVRIDRRGHGAPDEAFYTFIYSPLRDAESPGSTPSSCSRSTSPTKCWPGARRRSLTRRLRESEAQFHLLAETIPQLAWSTRPDGYIDWYNQRWYDYTGTTFETMQGWGWRSVHDPALRRRSGGAVAGVARRRRAVRDGVSAPRARRRVPLASHARRAAERRRPAASCAGSAPTRISTRRGVPLKSARALLRQRADERGRPRSSPAAPRTIFCRRRRTSCARR